LAEYCPIYDGNGDVIIDGGNADTNVCAV
jgi:hypothetical protein